MNARCERHGCYAAPAFFLLAALLRADCALDMNAYYQQKLFAPGQDVARTIFLIGLRHQFIFNRHPATAICQGKAYAWELLGQVAKSTPDSGADWSEWEWSEPGPPKPSRFNAAISLYTKANGTGTASDFDTFEMIHLNPKAAKYASERMMAPNERKKANALGWRTFEEFPAGSTEVKTIWRHIPENGCIALGIWDDLQGLRGVFEEGTWTRHALVYDAPPGAAAPACDQAASPTRAEDPRLRAQDRFVWMRVSSTILAERKTRFKPLDGGALAPNDLLILVGMHIARKDAPDWTWMTAWWKSKDVNPAPQETLGRDRVIPPTSVWSNYVSNYALSFQFPCPERACSDGRRAFVFNPYLEATHLPNGTASNCIACHAKARLTALTGDDPTTVPVPFGSDLMVYRFEGTTMTDYSWTAAK